MLDPHFVVAPVTQEATPEPELAKGSMRIATLKVMVADGTYHIDMETLASRLVDDERGCVGTAGVNVAGRLDAAAAARSSLP
jgi:hypothetical protein